MRCVAFVGAALLLVVDSASSQEVSLLLGGVHARYADSLSGTAGTASLRLSASSARNAGIFETALSQFATGEWAVQFSSRLSAMASLGERAAIGILANGALSNLDGGAWNGSGGVGPVLVVGSERARATLNLSGGAVRNVDESSVGFMGAGIGFQYAAASGVSVTAGVSGTRADTIGYADGVLGMSLRQASLLLSVQAGARAGDLSDDPWGQARIEWSGPSRAILEAAAGRYPRDLVGFTDGLFVTLGIRVALRRSSTPAPIPTPTLRRTAPDVPVRVQSLGGGRVRVLVRYEDAARGLAIAGDWNDWTPVPLLRGSDGMWTVELSLPPGLYKFSLVVDGEEWTIPAGVASVPDEFGGTVGLLAVPRS